MEVYFSDVFNVDEESVHEYGAFNVSLVNDLPLFVDPFLLFNSKNPKYQQLHADIIEYVCFLRDRVLDAPPNGMAKGLVKAWFYFPEVKQNWLGYSLKGNGGRGLGHDFALSLLRNLRSVFAKFGAEEISKSSHLEKLSLIDGGIGRDMISDFTSNMIKRFLCDYSQGFAQQHLPKRRRRDVMVKKVWFDYDTRTWADQSFELPWHGSDYVLLTPRNMLTKDETWINRPDFLHQVENLARSVPNDQLRHQLSQYLLRQMRGKRSEKERLDVLSSAIQEFPQLLDYYVKSKEDRGGQAESISQAKVQATYDRYVEHVRKFVTGVLLPSGFYEDKRSADELTSHRLRILKQVCEASKAQDLLCHSGKAISDQKELTIIWRLIWAANPTGPNTEDSVARMNESFDSISFKLASNRRLADSVQKTIQSESETTLIFVLTESDSDHIARALKTGELQQSNRVQFVEVVPIKLLRPVSRSRSLIRSQPQCRILFLAANPKGTTNLALDEECREIGQKIRASDLRDVLEFQTRWATRPDDLLQSLNETKPHVVHFSGHGSEQHELVLMDSNRNPKPVSAKSLRQLFATLKDNVRVVFLNACYSSKQAEAICENIDCAIGMNCPIGDTAAIIFAAAFYRAVGFGRSVLQAFEQGQAALMLEDISEEQTPALITRHGVDPAKVFLIPKDRHG